MITDYYNMTYRLLFVYASHLFTDVSLSSVNHGHAPVFMKLYKHETVEAFNTFRAILCLNVNHCRCTYL